MPHPIIVKESLFGCTQGQDKTLEERKEDRFGKENASCHNESAKAQIKIFVVGRALLRFDEISNLEEIRRQRRAFFLYFSSFLGLHSVEVRPGGGNELCPLNLD